MLAPVINIEDARRAREAKKTVAAHVPSGGTVQLPFYNCVWQESERGFVVRSQYTWFGGTMTWLVVVREDGVIKARARYSAPRRQP